MNTATSILLAILLFGGGGAATVAGNNLPPDYSREAFGDGWRPTGPGCDMRDTILERDLEPEQVNGCNVVAGTLADPYTGQVVEGPASSLDVDHVVPLALAWRLGAWEWTPAQRQDFANDPANLQTTTAAQNRAKSDSGLDEWLPAREPCLYALRLDQIADRYGLRDSARNHDVTNACDGRP
jgi:hypothetical protein